MSEIKIGEGVSRVESVQIPDKESQEEGSVTPEMQNGLASEICAVNENLQAIDGRISARAIRLGADASDIDVANKWVGLDQKKCALQERLRRLAAAGATMMAFSMPAFAQEAPDTDRTIEPTKIAMLQSTAERVNMGDATIHVGSKTVLEKHNENTSIEGEPQSKEYVPDIPDDKMEVVRNIPSPDTALPELTSKTEAGELHSLNSVDLEKLGIDRAILDAMDKVAQAIVGKGVASPEALSALGDLIKAKQGEIGDSMAEKFVPFYSGGKKIKEAMSGELKEGGSRFVHFLKGLGSVVLDYATFGRGSAALEALAKAKKAVTAADTIENTTEAINLLNYMEKNPGNFSGIMTQLNAFLEHKTISQQAGEGIEKAIVGESNTHKSLANGKVDRKSSVVESQPKG